jgi:hypothetical protein
MNMIEISFREVPPILFFDETPYCFIIFNSGEIVFSKDYHGVIIKSRSNAEPITGGCIQIKNKTYSLISIGFTDYNGLHVYFDENHDKYLEIFMKFHNIFKVDNKKKFCGNKKCKCHE